MGLPRNHSEKKECVSRGQRECKRTSVVGEVDGVHDIDVEAEELEREGCSLVPAVAGDDVRLDAQDSPAGHFVER